MVREGIQKASGEVKLRASQLPDPSKLLSVADIARAFMMLVTEDKYAGAVMSVTKEMGITLHYMQPMKETPFQQIVSKL